MQGMISENRDQNLFLGFILLFFCFALLFNLGGRTLENNDYLHYAEIGREILETGDWVIMHNGGKIYVDKPPLHSMNMALSFKLFGVSPFAARFPGAFFGLAGVLATFFFGMRIKQGQDLKTGIYASLLLLSSYGYFFLTRRPRNDIEYAVLFSLCLILFYEGYETSIKKHKFLFYALFWTCMGFAALVKGPAAFLPLLIIALYLFIQKGWKQAGGKAFFATSLLLPAVVLPYLILLVLHKDFPEFMTILKNHTIMTRSGGPLYYIPVFFEKYFPAGIFLALSLPVLWKEKKIFRENPRMAFVLTWACVYLFSIQLIKAKVYRYLLPAFPPLSIITAWGVQKLLEKKALPESLWRYGKILAGILCLGWPIVIWVFRGWSWPALILSLAAVGIFIFVMKRSKDPVVFICIYFIICILFVDAMHTAANEKVSTVQKVYSLLQEENIQAEDILVYKERGRAGVSLGFYYNRLLQPRITDSNALKAKKGFTAILTNPESADEVINIFGKPRDSKAVKNHGGKQGFDYTILFYPKETRI